MKYKWKFCIVLLTGRHSNDLATPIQRSLSKGDGAPIRSYADLPQHRDRNTAGSNPELWLHYSGGWVVLSISLILSWKYLSTFVRLTGDQVSRKGTLTGGYYDTRLSRLEMQKTKQKIEIEIAETENVKENNRIRKEQVDTMINKTIDDLQRKETVRAKHEWVNLKEKNLNTGPSWYW